MAFILKSICKKYTGAATETLYTPTAPKTGIVTGVHFYNEAAGATSPLTLEVCPGGTGDYPISAIEFTISAQSTMTFNDPVTLGSGDWLRIIVGSSPTPTLTCMVSVLERD